MFEVPKDIRENILCCAEDYRRAVEKDNKIRAWLEENNLLNNSILDCFIDSVHLQFDGLSFIDFLKKHDKDEEMVGNDTYLL